jgi:hypothetical protein
VNFKIKFYHIFHNTKLEKERRKIDQKKNHAKGFFTKNICLIQKKSNIVGFEKV